MQLDACLRTFALNCADDGSCQKRVIFKCTDSRHAVQYETLRKEHPDVEFIAETDFHQDLQSALSGFNYVLFMVDDNLCVRRFRLGEIVSTLESDSSAIGFSLRLGRNTTFCYSYKDAPQEMPAAEEITLAETDCADAAQESTGKILRFPWVGAPYDFGYPMEVSSSVYRVPEILIAISSGDRIKHPNGLEERLDAEKIRFGPIHPELLCYESSAAFCNPLNVVQFNYLNRAAAGFDSSVSSLMERFDLGYRFDIAGIAGFIPNSCHQEKQMGFSPPRLGWEKISASHQINYSGGPSEGVAGLAPRALQCEIDARSLTDDSLQSVLVGLNLLGATAVDQSVPWIEALGKQYREKQIVEYNTSTRKIAPLEERLASALQLGREQHEAIVGQQKTIRDEIAGRQEAVAALLKEINVLQPALGAAKYELEQIHGKLWFRVLNQASNKVWAVRARLLVWLAFAKRLCGYRLRDVKALIQGDLESQLCDRQFHFRGWLLIKQTAESAKPRAGAFAFFGKNTKDVLAGIRSFITVQLCCDGDWLALVRFTEPYIGSKQPPAQSLWPKGKPLVSVVVSCRNAGATLMEAVNSALAQTWRDLEVVIVDDASDDSDTIRIIDSLLLPRARVVRRQNSKVPSARNTGIAASSGKYICCLEADDKLEPTYIERCLLRLEIEGFGICGIWRNPGLEDAGRQLEDIDFDRLLETNRLIKSAVFSRHFWENAGGIDPATADRFEDWEFWIRPAPLDDQAADVSEPLAVQPARGAALIDSTRAKFVAILRRIRTRYGRAVPGLETRTLLRSQWRQLLDREMGSDQVRVLVCLPFLTIGGAEKILSQVCRGLRAEGFQFTVVTTRRALLSQGNSADWFEPATTEIFCLPECLAQESWNGFVSYLISSRKVDILLQAGSTFIYDLLPELKTLFPELKVVDNLFNEVGHTANNRKYDYLIDLHIVENNHIRRWLVEHGESEDRIRVIPNGVELSSFETNKRPPAPFDTGGRGFIVGFFGRLSKEKGPDLFVEIAERLKHEKNILFVIGGHGQMENAVREQIAERGLQDSVKMLGFCPVETHLSCCDLLVLPSRQDGRPNVVMEAMAMGVPVVASRVGGLPELVLEGYSGFLCDALDTRQFSDKIAMLSHDPERCEKLRSGAQQHAREHFDIRKTVSSFSGVFRELLRRPAPPQLVEAAVE